jgi:hypothetical protein
MQLFLYIIHSINEVTEAVFDTSFVVVLSSECGQDYNKNTLISSMKIENVTWFKYLVATLAGQNEMKRTLNLGIVCHRSCKNFCSLYSI